MPSATWWPLAAPLRATEASAGRPVWRAYEAGARQRRPVGPAIYSAVALAAEHLAGVIAQDAEFQWGSRRLMACSARPAKDHYFGMFRLLPIMMQQLFYLKQLPPSALSLEAEKWFAMISHEVRRRLPTPFFSSCLSLGPQHSSRSLV